jgi:hypothetical protein
MKASARLPSTIASRPEHRTMAWARAVGFVVVLAWIVGAPLYRQVLAGSNAHARAWVMYSGIGLGVVDARFYERRPDGTRRPLDRFRDLEVGRPVRPAARRLVGQRATLEIARRLCRRLGKDADVRVVARRATREGWLLDYDGEENLCTAPRPRPRPGEDGRDR